MKFCKDCMFCSDPTGKDVYARCGSMEAASGKGEEYLVTGNIKNGSFCSVNRLFKCGSEAKYFQPRLYRADKYYLSSPTRLRGFWQWLVFTRG